VKNKNTILFIGGILFGFGLAYSGMAKQEIVLSFLKLKDLGLLFVMAGAAILDFIAINIVPRFVKKPVMNGEFKPRTRILNRNTILGAIIFGVGWGISGQCPGSAIASLGIGNIPVLIGIAAMFMGAYVMGRFFG
jgi:uncharacterized membrane protein YedE/YeeE